MLVEKKEETREVANDIIIADYFEYVGAREFACVAAKAALSKGQIKCMVATHMACPKDDRAILQFLYSFIDGYRNSDEMYHSAAVIFQQPASMKEEVFDDLLWERLQSLSSMDAANFGYDTRVDFDPASPNFSYSLKEEAFFIIGLHPQSSRSTRQFKYPTLVFNPHRQFEQLKETAKYQSLKHVVRKRDIAYSGSVNPMLEDFGAASEVYQYSGRRYDQQWQCPLKINHVTS
jgi:FPC/CPF motif-containing protein YcgG